MIPGSARAIFTLRETAVYLDVPKSTVQWWARPPKGRGSLITCFPPRGRQATVPFIGFAEAFVLSSFRRAGVPLQRIRPAVRVLSKEIGVEHALASKRLYTDGAEVLFDYANRRGETEVADLVVLRTKQHQFTDVVRDYLQRIDYGSDGWADRVRLPTYGHTEVIVDPRVAFGLPLVVHGGARVEDLVDRFQAGDSVGEISADFDVPPNEVEGPEPSQRYSSTPLSQSTRPPGPRLTTRSRQASPRITRSAKRRRRRPAALARATLGRCGRRTLVRPSPSVTRTRRTPGARAIATTLSLAGAPLLAWKPLVKSGGPERRRRGSVAHCR